MELEDEKMIMERILKSRWLVKVIAFLLSLLLFMNVSIDSSTNQPNTNPFLSFLQSNNNPNSFEEAKLISYYDKEQYVVDGLPEEVSIFLKGPESIITKTKLSPAYEVYVDLRGFKVGTHRVKIEHRNFSDKLDVSIAPEFINVTIQEKISKLLPVTVEVINVSKLSDGYTYNEPIISPNSVKITGAKGLVNKIALIKGYVNIAHANKTVERSVPIFVYDHNGNEISGLDVYPSVLDVKVPITSPYKTIPLKIEEINKLPKGISIVSISINPSVVTIYGKKEKIDQYEFLDGLKINLASIRESKQFTINVQKPEHVTRVSPDEVVVHVEVEAEKRKTFEEVSIKLKGLSNELQASIISPENSSIDIDLLGAESVLRNVTLSDFETYVDLSQYSEGTHEIKIEFNGPQYVNWNANVQTAIIKIDKKN
jgi:YbbR domain-containing protein